MTHEHCVLIVADDHDCRGLLAELLTDAGYISITATNGAEALAILRERAGSVCIVLLDLMMPVMNGWQFRSAQLADPTICHVPVGVLTADAHAVRHSQLQAQALLAKPVDVNKLLSLVPDYCRR